MIAFQFCPCDGGIGVAQVCEHGINTDIGEAEDVIIKSGEIDAINNGKDLFLISSVMVMAVASCLRQVS